MTETGPVSYGCPQQADVLLNTDLRPLREVAGQVIHQFRLVQAAAP